MFITGCIVAAATRFSTNYPPIIENLYQMIKNEKMKKISDKLWTKFSEYRMS